MRASNRSAVVIGAGIVGVCCALQLQRRGVQVTLVDREEPGTQCSFGNAGRIARALCTPRSLPGLAWKVPGMLLDRRHPLKVGAAHLLRNLPWFARFLRSGSPARAEAIADRLDALLAHADRAFDDLVDDPRARALIRPQGAMYVFRDPARAAAARVGVDYQIRRGHRVEMLTGGEARELEPALPADVTSAFYWPGESYVASPLGLTQRLAARLADGGATVLRDEVRGFEPRDGRSPAVRLAATRIEADTVVVAAGAWSSGLAGRLGLALPIQAERGYHVTLPAGLGVLSRPVNFADRLVGFTPMDDGMRVVSGAEFAPVDAPADPRRIEPLLEAARDLFPDVATEGMRPWMGPRPSLPDSLPAIGAFASRRDVLFACGHGQLGLTLSAFTGELIADLATGVAPAVDPEPYRPDRF